MTSWLFNFPQTEVFQRVCALQLGKIVWHHDVWNNKGFGVLSFMKRPNGAFSGAIFKALGWKKDVYANQ